ncbi:hypothetical protein Z947_3529 [Sulfitobacter geojensis]|nr:hypothetical protein Z947_3529 [Sulfitobacter geojensis]
MASSEQKASAPRQIAARSASVGGIKRTLSDQQINFQGVL